MNNVLTWVFSYNRPMQLRLCLESLYINCVDDQYLDIKVLYKADEEYLSAYDDVYDVVKRCFKNIEFIRENKFSEDIMKIYNEKYDYVFFIVDDTVFTRIFDIKDCTDRLKYDPKVLGFSLRLGKNTTYCYSLDQLQYFPTFLNSHTDYLFWDWGNASGDWGYPLEVSSSIYRMSDIIPFNVVTANNPNELEWLMWNNRGQYHQYSPLMASFKHSVAFANPINKINKDNKNRAGNKKEYSVENLLKLYNEGYKIAVDHYQNISPNSCHQEMNLAFQKVGK